MYLRFYVWVFLQFVHSYPFSFLVKTILLINDLCYSCWFQPSFNILFRYCFIRCDISKHVSKYFAFYRLIKLKYVKEKYDRENILYFIFKFLINQVPISCYYLFLFWLKIWHFYRAIRLNQIRTRFYNID